MRNRKFPIFMYFIIGIAVIGLLSILLKNPSSLLMTLLGTVFFAGLIFFLVTALLNRNGQSGIGMRATNDEMKKYRQAVRQSKQKYGQSKKRAFYTATPQKQQGKAKLKRRRPTHLRVIEGKKSTAMNRKDDDLASN